MGRWFNPSLFLERVRLMSFTKMVFYGLILEYIPIQIQSYQGFHASLDMFRFWFRFWFMNITVCIYLCQSVEIPT